MREMVQFGTNFDLFIPLIPVIGRADKTLVRHAEVVIMKQTALFLIGLSILGFNARAQEAIDEFELETETAFFEAQNAEQQLRDSKDLLLKEQLETKAAQERAKAVSQQASETKARVQAERINLEKQRVNLAKQKVQYQRNIQKKIAEIKRRNSELQKDRTSLAALAKEVRDLKRRNQSYQLQINAQKRSERQLKQYMAEGHRLKKIQKRSLAKREKVLRDLGQKSASSLGRQPASISRNDSLNVTLHPKRR